MIGISLSYPFIIPFTELDMAVAATQAEMEAATSVDVFSSPGRQHFHPGHPKAWVRFQVTGTIDASYNITSITDNAPGDWTVNIATDFSSANYGAQFGASGDVDVGDSNILDGIVVQDGANAPAAGTFRMNCGVINAGGGTVVKSDPTGNRIWATFFGDQA